MDWYKNNSIVIFSSVSQNNRVGEVGWSLPEFFVKELTIYDEINRVHETFKPTKQLKELDESTKKQVRYWQRYHHMLRFSDGAKDQTSPKQILIEHIKENGV